MSAQAAPVNIKELKEVPAPREARLPAVTPGFGDLQSFEMLQRAAKVLSASTLVPTQYQGSEGLPNAIVALNMALRMQADPLMVMQNLYVVHGRPAWSAQFLVAAFNRCGRYSALRYEWHGSRGSKDWGCRAWAVEKETGERINGPLVTMATAESEGWTKRSGSKWLTIPELMLTYRAAAWLVRTNAPEIAMGLPTAEEAEDVVTLTPDQYTVAQVAAGEHATAAAAAPAPPEAPAQPAPERPTLSYAHVRAKLDAAKTRDALDEAAAEIALVVSVKQQGELTELYKAAVAALEE